MIKKNYLFPISFLAIFIILLFVRIIIYFLPFSKANILYLFIFVPLSYLLSIFIWKKIPIWQLDRKSSLVFFLGIITIFVIGSFQKLNAYSSLLYIIGIILLFSLSILELLLGIYYKKNKAKFEKLSSNLLKLTKNPDRYNSWLKIIFVESVFLLIIACIFLI